MAIDKTQKYCAEISWTIEKLSQWNIKLKGRIINSPSFRIKSLGNCSWYLKLTPRGEITGDTHVHVYLVLFAGELLENINCEMLFMCRKECLRMWNSRRRGTVEVQATRSLKHIKLSPCLIQEDIFQSESPFLLNDTLNIRCLIRKTEILLTERISFNTRVFSESRRLLWKIRDFSNLKLRKSASYNREFLIQKSRFADIGCTLSLTGVTLEDSVVEFELKARTIERLFFACELRVKIREEDEYEEEEDEEAGGIGEIRKILTQSKKYHIFNFPNSIPRRELLKYLQNGVLTIVFKVTFVTGDYAEGF